jgi:predicted cytidylate kinase
MNKESEEPFRNIVVCGDVGTGTSTLAKGLAERLGWEYISVGDFFRSYHKKNSIPLWNKAAIPDDLEKKVDSEFLEKMKKEKGYVIDSHYGGWFSRDLDGVFRILLVCDKGIAAQRIIDREQSGKETSQQIEKRRKQLRKKFKKLYSSDDYENPKYFHLVIDTTTTGVQETISTALDKLLPAS